MRNRLGLKQKELAEKAGVGLRFIRELEQGKNTLRIDKVNQVLSLFGYSLIPGKELDPYDIHENYFNKNVQVFLKNKSVLYGFIIDQVREGAEIVAWKFVSNSNAIEYGATKKEDLVLAIPHRDIERIENV
ncbi:MAG: helix-turn-helix transcriptional regulator [Flavisolibacter sp.]|nr:helix-turn-helix transcriptional regulator [Flavisolibacter sp.]